jgi:hypothetical protein
MDTTLRPMSTSQLLDRTFHLYRNNFLLFAGIAALPPALFVVVQLIVTFLQHSSNHLSEGAGMAVACIAIISVAGLFVAYVLGHYVATGATVYAVSQVYFGNPATIVGSYAGIRSQVWRIIGASILIGIMIGIVTFVAYLVLIIPMFMAAALMKGSGAAAGIVGCGVGFLVFGGGAVAIFWVACKFSLAVPACVVEKLGVIACLQRSWFLSQKSVWRIFLIYFLVGILTIALSLALSIPNYIAIGFRGTPSLPYEIWGIIASFLASAIAEPIGAIAISLVYYDQRVRKEAFDLQLMMQAMGEPVAPPPILPPPPPPITPPTAPPAIGL